MLLAEDLEKKGRWVPLQGAVESALGLLSWSASTAMAHPCKHGGWHKHYSRVFTEVL